MSAPSHDHHLRLLRQLVTDVRHARSVLLLSSDGIAKTFTGMDQPQADGLAAAASGLFSLARSAARQLGAADGVRQVVAELDDHLLFVSAAASGAVLALVCDRDADAADVGFAMQKLIAAVGSSLDTPDRAAAA